VRLGAIAAAPLLPIVGFHLNQARKQFRAGHTLADLRTALEVARRERAETEAVVREEKEPRSHQALRVATVASASWLAVTFVLLAQGTIHENRTRLVWVFGPVLTTLVLGALSNALDVQFIPNKLREWWQTGIRERLWKSRAGEWLARRLGAPERSQVVGPGVFRATEAALGVAASELFAALPNAYREQLAELPAMVAALEARAAEARAEIEVLAELAQSGNDDADVLRARREAASAHLTESVAALETIRLDLLRLHAGANDLAPLTTLIDAARVLGDDVKRLADAQREVDAGLK
jgi:serine/threonine-protein kinase